MDRLSTFFSHFSLSARIFLAGTLCGTSSDHKTETAGHLHLLRRGKMTIFEYGKTRLKSRVPVLCFTSVQVSIYSSRTVRTSCVPM